MASTVVKSRPSGMGISKYSSDVVIKWERRAPVLIGFDQMQPFL